MCIWRFLPCSREEGFLGIIEHNRLTHEKAFLPKAETQLPGRYQDFAKSYPGVMQAVEALGEATRAAGPLDKKTCTLVKLAIALGALREGAVHSHTRRALEAGCTPDELRHVGVLAITTIGFPSTMATMSWVEDILRT